MARSGGSATAWFACCQRGNPATRGRRVCLLKSRRLREKPPFPGNRRGVSRRRARDTTQIGRSGVAGRFVCLFVSILTRPEGRVHLPEPPHGQQSQGSEESGREIWPVGGLTPPQ